MLMTQTTRLFVFWMLTASSTVMAGDAVRPNIVFFVVDDLGYRDLSCYGSTFYETPHVDRLAQQGTRLTRCYAACPVCSPTRASLMTGKYPQRTGITDYIGAAQPEQWKRNTRHLPANYSVHLALEEFTIAEALKGAGYATAHFGKWHLGSVRRQSDANPGVNGFDEWLSAPNYYDNDPILSHRGKAVAIKGESSVVAAEVSIVRRPHPYAR